MKINIAGYDYFDSRTEALKQVKTNDDNLAYEAGLGWYVHSKKEYTNNPRKKMFGF